MTQKVKQVEQHQASEARENATEDALSERGLSIVSDVTIFTKYSRFNQEAGRRELWREIVDRNIRMHIKRFPALEMEIRAYYEFVYARKVLPSMRSLQFGGKAIETNHTRMYNCAYCPLDNVRSFAEALFLLLGGTGVGYSVQRKHVAKLPAISQPTRESTPYVIPDSIEGWADALHVLLSAYIGEEVDVIPKFDYSAIRPKGSVLKTAGGFAPGHEPLQQTLEQVERILRGIPSGTKLRPIDCHDIMCHVADCVVAGGIRRSAMLSLFSLDDREMLLCKSGEWWKSDAQRMRANNSASVLRGSVSREDFFKLWSEVEASGSGEPGIYFTNDEDWGVNPCCVSGDTWIHTENGPRQARELVGKPCKLWVNGTLYPMESRGFFPTGRKELFRVTTGAGYECCITADHRLINSDGEWKELRELVPGDRIMLATHANTHSWSGMGTFESGCAFAEQHVFGEFPAQLHQTSSDFHIGFLHTLFRHATTYDGDLEAGDAFIVGFGLTMDNRGLLQQVQRMLMRFAIYTRLLHLDETQSRLCLCDEYLLRFHDTIGVPSEHAQLAQTLEHYRCVFESHFGHMYWDEIARIEPMGVDTVYDVTVAEVHEFDGDGFRMHNCEIALNPYQFCNVNEINASDVHNQEELEARVRAAAFIGTLQASYTEFPYLRPIWRQTTEREALLGIGMTGIGSGAVLQCDLWRAAEVAKEENARVAKLIGIREAARVNTLKPSGTTSLVLGCSSGIHAWHAPYYIRRMRVGKDEAIYAYFQQKFPTLVEDDLFSPSHGVLSFPIKAPEGSLFRDEPVEQFLDRIYRFNTEWVAGGHRRGKNRHNVSATVSVKQDEWQRVGEWLWQNQHAFNGISVLPYDNGTYQQAPFEDCDRETFERMSKELEGFDIAEIMEKSDHTNPLAEGACTGDKCEFVPKKQRQQ